jgi:hypothetical protein
MGRKEAAGADGLEAHSWAWWPAVHWDKLAQLVQRCESEGKWPEQLRLAHVALLSKGGKPVRGLSARPITVLPLVYRAWAKIRARQLRVWLEGHPELLVGSRQEAEFQAAILAATLSLVKATGLGAGAACLDWSKAYDTIDLNLLEQGLLKAGLPPALVRPAMSMYRAARAVKIVDAVGNPMEPWFGLPAGCPFATFFWQSSHSRGGSG